jgi:hypothetical protein
LLEFLLTKIFYLLILKRFNWKLELFYLKTEIRCSDTPVKHQYVDRAVDWPYSTIHDYILKGELSDDWGGYVDNSAKIEFGERP